MLILVVSDFHLGRGRYFSNGLKNIFEDFFEDEKFAEFLAYYSTGKNYLKEIHLVLNGDILNLLQIDIDGIFTHVVDEELTINALKSIHKGHLIFFEAIKEFLKKPNKTISYIIGNHDAAMIFEGAQKEFNQIVDGQISFSFFQNIHGVYIEHGHRFDVVNTVDEKDYFIIGPGNKKVINLPWASLFCILVLPKLKKERPYFDKIRPLSAYIKWCILNDFHFFWRIVYLSAIHFLKASSSQYSKLNRGLFVTFKMFRHFTHYPRFDKVAKKILRKSNQYSIVILGHVHLSEWRRFPEGKQYFNSGSWNVIPSVDVAKHEDVAKLTYIVVDLHPKTGIIHNASLNNWFGSWKPYKEEVSSRI